MDFDLNLMKQHWHNAIALVNITCYCDIVKINDLFMLEGILFSQKCITWTIVIAWEIFESVFDMILRNKHFRAWDLLDWAFGYINMFQSKDFQWKYINIDSHFSVFSYWFVLKHKNFFKIFNDISKTNRNWNWIAI